MRLPRVLQPKWKLFRHHHTRLAQRPDPAAAESKFQRRVGASRRVGAVRTGFFVGLYFSFFATAVSFVLDYFNVTAEAFLAVIQTVFSSLTVAMLAGIFVCTRYLGHLEVDLYYYSAESRLRPH